MPSSVPIEVVPYDPAWPGQFAELAAVIGRALEGVPHRIEHVGSTSVTGLAAKPIIDIDVVIPSRDVLKIVIERLSGLGYTHQGDLEVSGREAFKGVAGVVPDDGTGFVRPIHHLYVCAEDCDELRRHLFFRDYLRSHPADAAAYAALKQVLAFAYRNDRTGYNDAKSEFVTGILEKAVAESQD